MKKSEIRVTIDSVKKHAKLGLLLIKYNQKFIARSWNNIKKHLVFFDDENAWIITDAPFKLKEITLDELEEILKSEK